MRLAGVSLNQFVKTGVTAVLFIILFKYLAERSRIPALGEIANRV